MKCYQHFKSIHFDSTAKVNFCLFVKINSCDESLNLRKYLKFIVNFDLYQNLLAQRV